MCGIGKGCHPHVASRPSRERRGASSRCLPAPPLSPPSSSEHKNQQTRRRGPQVCLEVKVEPDSDSEAEWDRESSLESGRRRGEDRTKEMLGAAHSHCLPGWSHCLSVHYFSTFYQL